MRTRLARSPLDPRLAALLLALTAAGPVLAQYKWIGPDGSVNYGDRPPVTATDARPLTAAPARSAPTTADLPFGLREVTQRFPVTLYTGADCAPCDSARRHLASRGIPFTERTLNRQADIDAFRALGFAEPMLPTLVVGRERSVGYEPQGWNSLLDAAGYPATSQLPANWRGSSATPLAPPSPPPRARASRGADAESTADGDERAQGSARNERGSTGIVIPPPPPPGTIRF